MKNQQMLKMVDQMLVQHGHVQLWVGLGQLPRVITQDQMLLESVVLAEERLFVGPEEGFARLVTCSHGQDTWLTGMAEVQRGQACRHGRVAEGQPLRVLVSLEMLILGYLHQVEVEKAEEAVGQLMQVMAWAGTSDAPRLGR